MCIDFINILDVIPYFDVKMLYNEPSIYQTNKSCSSVLKVSCIWAPLRPLESTLNGSALLSIRVL